MKNTIICESCGAKKVEYRFALNKGISAVLIALYKAGGPAKTRNSAKTYARYTNAAKVRYWDLGRPHVDDESKIKAGVWIITEKGKAFVEGRISLPRFAYTYRGKVTRFEGEHVTMSEISDGWDYRSDYQEQVREQGRRGRKPREQQPTLF